MHPITSAPHSAPPTLCSSNGVGVVLADGGTYTSRPSPEGCAAPCVDMASNELCVVRMLPLEEPRKSTESSQSTAITTKKPMMALRI